MTSVLAIRHVAFEDLGLLAPLLRQRGHTISYIDAPTGDLGDIDPLAPDLLVVLGGPIGANDVGDYPFLNTETALVERRLKAERPILGLCLGSQIMARALGARVTPVGQKEIGWAPITLTAAGYDSCLRHLDGGDTAVLHWHGDTFDLPHGAVRLGSTELCENQAFAWGTAALALQFHAEAAGPALEAWFVGHAAEIAATPDISVAQLRADTEHWTSTITDRGRQCFTEWLDGLGL